MANPKAALRDWQCKPKPPPGSSSIIPHCLICFCPSNARYVGGFVLIMAFAPIAGRGWFLSPHLLANAVGGRLPIPLAIIFAGLILPKCHPWPKSEAAFYIDRSRQLILKFKHGDALHLTPLFARFLKALFTALAEPDHLFVPIPLHAKRNLHRRFNQSAELARLLCQQNEAGIFAPEASARPKAGPTQAGLSRSQRQRNLAGAFAIPQDQCHRITNRPVLLIDDVMTTGATPL